MLEWASTSIELDRRFTPPKYDFFTSSTADRTVKMNRHPGSRLLKVDSYEGNRGVDKFLRRDYHAWEERETYFGKIIILYLKGE